MAKRRTNGEGSIYKRKVKCKDGSSYIRWEAAITLSYNTDGKQKRKVVSSRSQQETLRKLEEIKRQVSDGIFSETTHTVKTYLKSWLDNKARSVKPRTVELYGEQVDRYVTPRIGEIKLTKLTPLHIQNVVNDIADNTGIPTANKVRKLLYGALKQAVKLQLISRNPCEAVDTLKEPEREITLWTPEQTIRFLDHIRPHRLYAAFYLLIATGLRRGEVLGLKWDDLKNSKLHIRRNLTILDSKPAWSTPKTKKGERFVSLPADVLKILYNHRAIQQSEREYLGAAWIDEDLIFSTPIGGITNPSTFHHLWLRLQKEAGVPRVRLHDLRHLHVSLLVKQGVDIKTISDRVGHKDTAFTLRQYSHMFEEQRDTGALELSILLGSSTPLNSLN